MNLLLSMIALNCFIAAAGFCINLKYRIYNFKSLESFVFIFDAAKKAELFNNVLIGILVSGLMLSLGTMINSSNHFLLSLNISIILILQCCIYLNYFFRPSHKSESYKCVLLNKFIVIGEEGYVKKSHQEISI